MADEYVRALRLGALRIEQTADWLKDASGFRDTVVLSILNEGTHVAIVSLDDLVAFVTRAREEWRRGREAGQARVVKS